MPKDTLILLQLALGLALQTKKGDIARQKTRISDLEADGDWDKSTVLTKNMVGIYAQVVHMTKERDAILKVLREAHSYTLD